MCPRPATHTRSSCSREIPDDMLTRNHVTAWMAAAAPRMPLPPGGPPPAAALARGARRLRGGGVAARGGGGGGAPGAAAAGAGEGRPRGSACEGRALRRLPCVNALDLIWFDILCACCPFVTGAARALASVAHAHALVRACLRACVRVHSGSRAPGGRGGVGGGDDVLGCRRRGRAAVGGSCVCGGRRAARVPVQVSLPAARAGWCRWLCAHE